METLEYGTQTLEYDLVLKERKTLSIVVHPDLSIKVIAPNTAEQKDIEAKILKRSAWIALQRKYFEQFLPGIPVQKYVAGETHYYLGKSYPLKIIIDQQKDVKLASGKFHIHCKTGNPEEVKALLTSWYFNHAQVKFKEAFGEALERIHFHDIGRPKFEVKRMKNRWGSCTPQGRIFLNPDLIRAPYRSIYYVCLHELIHLVVPNHTKAFYELQSDLMPDWKRWKFRLDQFS
jgi:predicted metal-dependent hydrolase